MDNIFEEERFALPSRQLRVAEKGPTPIYNPLRFPKGPLPMYGIPFTLIDPNFANTFGLLPKDGRPNSVMVDTEGNQTYKKDSVFVDYINLANHNRPTNQTIESIRNQLECMKVQGHSITTKDDSEAEMAEILYNITCFGLWPRNYPDARDYLPLPWMGNFGKTGTGASAGDFFRGYGVVQIPQTSPIKVDDLNTSFISPLDLIHIVPADNVRDALKGLISKTFGISVHKLGVPSNFLDTHILSFNDIQQGKMQDVLQT